MTLKINNLSASYGSSQVLREVTFDVGAGEVLCLFGRNGGGKSTTLKAVMGLVQRSGSVTLDGEELIHMPAYQIPRYGIGYVPQGRRLFAELTVAENLEIGLLAGRQSGHARERVLSLFPPLQSRLRQVAGTLSGGEQQMLAMARALCLEPDVLLLDEPTEGLMPSMINTIRDVTKGLRESGVAILLVEQRIDAVLPVADRVVFMENGRVPEIVAVDRLRGDLALLHRYVGIST